MTLQLRLRLWLTRAQNHTWEGKSSNELLFHELYTTILVSNNSKWLFGLGYFLYMILCLVRVPSHFGQWCQLPQSKPCSFPHSRPIFLLLSISASCKIRTAVFPLCSRRYRLSSSFEIFIHIKMSDSTTSATRAGIDIVDLAIAQLRAEAKSHSKLGLAFNVLGLLFLILCETPVLLDIGNVAANWPSSIDHGFYPQKCAPLAWSYARGHGRGFPRRCNLVYVPRVLPPQDRSALQNRQSPAILTAHRLVREKARAEHH